MSNYLWIIPFAPLFGAIINGTLSMMFAGREKGPNEKMIGALGTLAPTVSFIVAVMLFMDMRAHDAAHRVYEQTLFTWIKAGPLHLDFAFMVDQLSMVMVLIVTGIGSLIHLYSIGYMHGDRGFARFFTYLNLFMFSMLTLVMGSNIPMLFVGWEGVGLCSYLLIGFWYKDLANAAAGKKAFVVNRIGDFAFLIGMFILFKTTSDLGGATLDFAGLREMVGTHPAEFTAIATAACIFMFIGATGKSAQIPLYVWLPDAMAGPTPVSALIHAATMVTAGVYMIARMNFLYTLSPTAMAIVATVGAVTAVFAATIGFAQRDIKKVLAYSTVSQLGYMFLAVGVGAYSAGVFHLMTHAFFKACLFLGSGSVIHAMSGEQDMFKMGGLSKHMRTTWLTFVISSVAIAGIPPLAGFFSKDEILWYTWSASIGPEWLPKTLWIIGFCAAGMTAFYVFRAVFLTFHGEERISAEAKAHLHESPPLMTIPLIVLAIGACVVGFLGVPEVLPFGANHFHHWLAPVVDAAHSSGHGADHALATVGVAAAAEAGHETTELLLMGLSILMALFGIFMAFLFYIRKPDSPAAFSRLMGPFYKLVRGKYFVDEAYDAAIVKPSYQLSEKILFRVIDRGVIEGVVNGVGIMARLLGSTIRMAQSGAVRTYGLFFLIGVLLIFIRLLT